MARSLNCRPVMSFTMSPCEEPAGVSPSPRHPKASRSCEDGTPPETLPPHYELTGTVEWAREPSTLLLRVGTVRVLAEPNSFRTVRTASGEVAGAEPYSPSFWVPAIGTRVTAVCRLEVMADYETDAFAFPDIRRDWRVRKVLVEHRSRVQPTTGGGDSIVGRVVRVDTIDRMRRWADENGRDHVTYCLDLRIRR